MKIKFCYDNVKYRLKHNRELKQIIKKIITEEKKSAGDLLYIITNDRSIRKINKEFLKHDYFTDVISFSYIEEGILNGEVYISIDTVRINAHNYKVSLLNEMARVIIHGTLHLCGYDDGTEAQKREMSILEDKWLKKLTESVNGF